MFNDRLTPILIRVLTDKFYWDPINFDADPNPNPGSALRIRIQDISLKFTEFF